MEYIIGENERVDNLHQIGVARFLREEDEEECRVIGVSNLGVTDKVMSNKYNPSKRRSGTVLYYLSEHHMLATGSPTKVFKMNCYQHKGSEYLSALKECSREEFMDIFGSSVRDMPWR